MVSYKPVTISNASFTFCRYSMAVIAWGAFLFHSEIILVFVNIIFLLSAILKVKKAPMIRFYDVTFNRLGKPKEVMLNQNAIFFAHSVGFTMSALCVVLVLTVANPHIWFAVLGFSILKTISALGFCPASKLYDCTINGNCCVKHDKRNGYNTVC